MDEKTRAPQVDVRDPELGAPKMLDESSSGNSQSGLSFPIKTVRNVLIVITLISAVFWAMHSLAVIWGLNIGLFHAVLGFATFVLTVLFCVMGQTVVEDGVLTVITTITGFMASAFFPLPWCLVPAAGILVGSIVNGAIQIPQGRY